MDLFTQLAATRPTLDKAKITSTDIEPKAVKGNIPFTPFVSEPDKGSKPFLLSDKAMAILKATGLQLGQTTWGWVVQEDLAQTAVPCFRGRKWQKNCYLPLFTAAELEQILPISVEVSYVVYTLRYSYTQSNVSAAYVNANNTYLEVTERNITKAMTSLALLLMQKGISIELPTGTDFSLVYDDGSDKVITNSSKSVYVNGAGMADVVKPSDLPQTATLMPIGEIDKKTSIDETFKRFGLDATYVSRTNSAALVTYEYRCKGKTSIANIKSRAADIAIDLKVSGCRVIAMNGKNTIGVEIPRSKRDLVSVNTLLAYADKESSMTIPLVMGKDSMNTLITIDLAAAPHLLVAGSTNSGKSVGINVILNNLLERFGPDELKLLLIDPKKVELNLYEPLENYLLGFYEKPKEDNDDKSYTTSVYDFCPGKGVITSPDIAYRSLRLLYGEMQRRYNLLRLLGCRNIEEYNTDTQIQRLPFIVGIIDEFASLSSNSDNGKDIMNIVSQLAALARATGIHLVVATQSPRKEVITGVIKNNFPTRIAFRVPTNADSRVILDQGGAEQLIGQGDALLFAGATLERFQCAYISTEEVKTLVRKVALRPCYDDFAIEVSEALKFAYEG